MLSFKNSLNILLNFVISKLAQTYIVQELVGTLEKVANSTSDQVMKYGKFGLISLISLHHEFFIT